MWNQDIPVKSQLLILQPLSLHHPPHPLALPLRLDPEFLQHHEGLLEMLGSGAKCAQPVYTMDTDLNVISQIQVL